MSEMTGLAGGDVLSGAALGVILLCALALWHSPQTRRRPGLSFAFSWLLLLFSAGLVTSAVVNLTLIGSSRLWMTAGGAGAIGILVTFLRGAALWRERSGCWRAIEGDTPLTPHRAANPSEPGLAGYSTEIQT